MWWQNRDIPTNLAEIERRILRACERSGRSPEEVAVVAVTKGVAPERIEEAFRLGLRHFGENRVQEAREKVPRLGHLPITWHMVGHLQSNKAKLALSLFQFFHSVDSLKLAQVLDSRSQTKVPVLLQVNVSGESTKFGVSPEEAPAVAEAISKLPHLELKGLMTIAPLVTDPEEVRPVFRRLRELRDALGLRELSMGMSEDFEVAVEEGATIVRLGRAIFGERREG